jgi:hypothetical protein
MVFIICHFIYDHVYAHSVLQLSCNFVQNKISLATTVYTITAIIINKGLPYIHHKIKGHFLCNLHKKDMSGGKREGGGRKKENITPFPHFSAKSSLNYEILSVIFYKLVLNRVLSYSEILH